MAQHWTPLQRIREQQIGKEGAALLAALLNDLRGDPRLTRWEEEFCTSLANGLREHGARMLLSDKQAAVLDSLRAKVEAPAPPDDAEPDPDL